MFENMQWLDISIIYKELIEIIKAENGNSDDSSLNSLEQMKSNMEDSYSSKMNEMKSQMPKMPTINMNSMTAGLKMPKI